MTNGEPRHLRFGTPLGEWVTLRATELEIDEVGFWQVVPEGRDGFGLTGPDLDDFVRRRLLALFELDAVPVRHVPGSNRVWTWQRCYGTSAEEMVESILQEWIGEGRPNPGLGDLWFSLKDGLDRPYVQKS